MIIPQRVRQKCLDLPLIKMGDGHRTGQVVNLLNALKWNLKRGQFGKSFRIKRLVHVCSKKLKIRIRKHSLDISDRGRGQIIQTDDPRSVAQEPLAQVRTEETGPTSNQRIFFLKKSLRHNWRN